MMADPYRWTSVELADLAAEATGCFRADRTNEPTVIYADFFEMFAAIFRNLIDEALPSLAETLADVNRELLAKIVSDQNARMAFRYLAAPPISDDDLRTLASARLSARALRADPEQAERVRDVVLNAIDPFRFPWIEAGRSPSAQERDTAIISSAVLAASQRVGTRRRNDARRQQEGRVKDLLRAMDFQEIPKRVIQLLEDGPRPGEFCGESKLGDTRADLVIRLPDRRYLAIECKVSNSAVNSFKRLNHEALGKAGRWTAQFGTRAVVPAAVLSGVFNAENLADAQDGGLYLFWAHRLDDLRAFIASCNRPAPRRRRP